MQYCGAIEQGQQYATPPCLPRAGQQPNLPEDLPLLPAGPRSLAASQRQHCALLSEGGSTVGSLWFGLVAQPIV